MGFCSMQESKEQLPVGPRLNPIHSALLIIFTHDQRAFMDRINDDTYAISDDGGRAWQSLLYSQWISLYPDTVQSLQAVSIF